MKARECHRAAAVGVAEQAAVARLTAAGLCDSGLLGGDRGRLVLGCFPTSVHAENVDDLDADRTGHADDTNLEGLVSAQHVERLLIRSPVDLAKQRRGRHRLASHRGRRLRASAEGERAATQAAQSKHDGVAHGLLISVALRGSRSATNLIGDRRCDLGTFTWLAPRLGCPLRLDCSSSSPV